MMKEGEMRAFPPQLGEAPDPPSLLAEAQRVLKSLPAEATERDYAIRMVLSALGMVERALNAATAAEKLLMAPADGKALSPAALVHAIRNGAFDADPALYSALQQASLTRCFLTKPQRLTEEERAIAARMLLTSRDTPSTSR
jgi:hypothetical protein